MEEYKPNSNRFKEEKKVAEASEKKISKVISGSAKTKRKSEVRKFTDIFMPEDISSVKSYVLLDILVPAVKRFISDTVDAVLYPNGGGHRKSSPASKVSYGGFYRDRNDRRETSPSRVRSGIDYDDIIFDNRGDADAVLSAMEEVINRYGVVSVGDLYDLAEVSTNNYAVNNYGWSDIHTATVLRVRDGYMLKLPRALPIN